MAKTKKANAKVTAESRLIEANVTRNYKDIQLKRRVLSGEKIKVTKERLDQLIQAEVVDAPSNK